MKKKQQLAELFQQQKEDFEIYGTVLPNTESSFHQSVQVAKLEDVKIDLNNNELDNFFSNRLHFLKQDETEVIAEDLKEEEDEKKQVVLLEDEEPEFK